MSRLHICNTFFEEELASNSRSSLNVWLSSHPVIRKLQTLPLLYASKEDFILVSQLPQNPDPRLCLIPPSPSTHSIEDWGPSQSIALWAKEHNISYQMPDWEVVRKIQSKTFVFPFSSLACSAILHSPEEVLLWIRTTPGPKVLKTPFGTAGRGHFHIDKSHNLPAFLSKHFAKNLPLICEPWVQRVFDFSTQWKNGQLLGATVFEATPLGSYRSTLAGPAHLLFGKWMWALNEHLDCVKPLLETIQSLGFFGHLGIDAFVYLQNGQEKLQPIVEINARKTMSWAALQIQKQRFPNQTCRLLFSPKDGISIIS